MHVPAAIIALSLATMLSASARAAGDADEGREIAERTCKGCHVIGEANLLGGIGSTPSFFLMQEKLDQYRWRILSVNSRRPHIAREFELTRAELEHLVAYISTLQRP